MMNCPNCTNKIFEDAGFCLRCGHRLLWKTGTILLDEFEVESELGAGGMGRVYLMKSRLSGYRFAVKTTRLADVDSRRRFSCGDSELGRSTEASSPHGVLLHIARSKNKW
jgi:hypothetical protein